MQLTLAPFHTCDDTPLLHFLVRMVYHYVTISMFIFTHPLWMFLQLLLNVESIGPQENILGIIYPDRLSKAFIFSLLWPLWLICQCSYDAYQCLNLYLCGLVKKLKSESPQHVLSLPVLSSIVF